MITKKKDDEKHDDADLSDIKSIPSFDESFPREYSDDIDIPDGEYFRGFFAFAIWGYIPPPDVEEYKSIMIGTVTKKRENR
mmetsp:Transcript_257/g.256  ORF Transcript_257/g.256 Transcript_257/m.256 type:complete len:81 (+) Transcript_257:362-604(+)